MPTSNPNPHPLTEANISSWLAALAAAGKSKNTLLKYRRDIGKFQEYVEGVQSVAGMPEDVTARCAEEELPIARDVLEGYQTWLKDRGYEASSINSYLVIAESFCTYSGVKVERPARMQTKETLVEAEESGLSYSEYRRLVRTAFRYEMPQLGMMIQVLTSTKLRYSELQYITVETLGKGNITVKRKNRTRIVRLPQGLRSGLQDYANREKITSGCLFVNRMGNFPDRSNIWKSMKKLCVLADVDPDKVSAQKLKNTAIGEYYTLGGAQIK